MTAQQKTSILEANPRVKNVCILPLSLTDEALYFSDDININLPFNGEIWSYKPRRRALYPTFNKTYPINRAPIRKQFVSTDSLKIPTKNQILKNCGLKKVYCDVILKDGTKRRDELPSMQLETIKIVGSTVQLIDAPTVKATADTLYYNPTLNIELGLKVVKTIDVTKTRFEDYLYTTLNIGRICRLNKFAKKKKIDAEKKAKKQ